MCPAHVQEQALLGSALAVEGAPCFHAVREMPVMVDRSTVTPTDLPRSTQGAELAHRSAQGLK